MIASEQIIYLDNNATTQLDPAVIEEMLPFLTDYYGNPSSGYMFGRQVRQAIDLARQRLAALLGCEPGEIVFTSCGTESNNAAVNSSSSVTSQSRRRTCMSSWQAMAHWASGSSDRKEAGTNTTGRKNPNVTGPTLDAETQKSASVFVRT